MASKEREIINKRLASLNENERLFRINAGMGWAGRAVKNGNIIIIKNPYPLHAAPEGWPDLCGWTTTEITSNMIGQKIAIFTAEEIKATGKLSTAQKRFKKIIECMGGIYQIIS